LNFKHSLSSAIAIAVTSPISLFGAGSTAVAEAVTWHTDPMGTYMELGFDHSKLIDVVALIGTVSGDAVIDDRDMTKSTFKVTADVRSALSYNDRWPHQLRSAEFFDTASTPEITFVSKAIARSRGGYKVTGTLTMHGVTQPREFFMTTSAILPYKDRRFRGITLTGEVDWHTFGMTYQDPPDLRENPEFGNSFRIRINCEFSDGPPPRAPQSDQNR
jgi:polyisoprenoid-binding protein YceI